MKATYLLVLLYICLSKADECLWLRSRGIEVVDDDRLTNDWAIQLEKGVDPKWFAEKYSLRYLGQVIDDVYHFQQNDTQDQYHHQRSTQVLWSQQQVAKRRSKRGKSNPIPTDPQYPSQWHLHTSDKSPKLVHLNVETPWGQGFTGRGVTVAIVDDGIEYTHPDLRDNYNAEGSIDVNFNDRNPFPDSSRDDHGTSAAGATAAGRNGVCGVGTAYNAKVSAIRILSKSTTDLDEATALKYRNDLNHIYSNSWGPIDDGRRKEGPGPLALAAIQESIRQGRQGKGTIYVWAGGNGRSSGDNCNYDGWANSRYTISIAAMTHQGNQAWYSESCSMLIGSAPSSGDNAAITTTDLMGSRGTNGGDCTTSFGGTSAAAPLAAGVVALILEANPQLTWRDVQGVLITSSRADFPSGDPGWVETKTPWLLRYNHKFGFGLIDATQAVMRAKQWKPLPPYKTSTSHFPTNWPITEESRIVLPMNDNFTIEHVDIYLVAQCANRGNLVITLESPSGTLSHLAEKHSDMGANYDWRFGSIVHWGESSQGIWTLIVRDTSYHGGIIESVKLDIHGHN